MWIPVFKTVEPENLGLAGWIPVRLRRQLLVPLRQSARSFAPRAGPDVRRLAAAWTTLAGAFPRTDRLLADPRIAEAADRLGRSRVRL